VLDGADDQDNDDVPNIMELSRRAASGYDDTDGRDCAPRKDPSLPTDPARSGDYGRVNPFNPCLPNLRLADVPAPLQRQDGRAVRRLAGLVLVQLAHAREAVPGARACGLRALCGRRSSDPPALSA
jgi:hypothetical protein